MMKKTPSQMQSVSPRRDSKYESSTQIKISSMVSGNKSETERSKYGSESEIALQQKDRSKPATEQPTSIKLGVCAMKKKVEGKPMQQILKRLQCQEVQIVLMHEYLEHPSYTWPKVDALIVFYSDGFPYLKAWRYVKKHKPFLFNDLQKQQLLWDRTVVYDILRRQHINVAKHYFSFTNKDYISQIENQTFGPDDQPYNQIPATIPSPKILDISYSQRKQTDKMFQFDFLDIGKNKKTNSSANFQIEKNRSRKRSNYKISQQHKSETQVQNKSRSLQKTAQLHKENSQNINNNQNTYRKLSSLLQNEETRKKEILKLNKNGNQLRPNTLRKFHEERKLKLKEYQILQIQDKLVITQKGQEGKVYKLQKPFVQKPFSAENHQIGIYYPQQMGGGRKLLFRKKKCTSSDYQADINNIRRDGNYIYEQFLPTNAFDIKIYTVGQHYMHAEARKSPTLDGVVERSSDGKEKRFPIILTPEEKFIAKKIVQAFGQKVCGFDLLRAEGKSYVCDVNGWSFVKNNTKYWDDCATILKRQLYKRFFPSKVKGQNSKYDRFQRNRMNQYRPVSSKQNKEQLRSIVSIFRHGDRSPKLKLKIKTKEQKIIDIFYEDKFKNKQQIKIKDAKTLTWILNIVRQIIQNTKDKQNKSYLDYRQMQSVLQAGGKFQEINRKVQIKVNKQTLQKKQETGTMQRKISEVTIILKWGGQLTYTGYKNAFEFGQMMRTHRYKNQDLLSLHSSYRHDLKTYSSDQGRCIKTAAAVLKGFLNIDGDLPPIITTMVNNKTKAQLLLDCLNNQNHSQISDKIKRQLSQMLNSESLLSESLKKYVKIQNLSTEMQQVIRKIGVPIFKLQKLNQYIALLTKACKNILDAQDFNLSSMDTQRRNSVYEQKNEQTIMVYRRWEKLHNDFYNSKQKIYNISKIPQIFDTIRHELAKNSNLFEKAQFACTDFYILSQLMAKFVVVNEYGISKEQKTNTAKSIISPLIQKIMIDLIFWKQKNYQQLYWKYKNQDQFDQTQWKHVRTRLYCTSASHMYSLRNILLFGNDGQLLKKCSPETKQKARNIIYLSYLSHIQFRLYETFGTEEDDPNRFRIEIAISPEYSRHSDLYEVNLGTNGFQISEIQELFNSITRGDSISSRPSTPKDQ